MKLLVITTIDAHKPRLLKLLKQTGISAYSSADISGHKETDQSSPIKNWFCLYRNSSRFRIGIFFCGRRENCAFIPSLKGL